MLRGIPWLICNLYYTSHKVCLYVCLSVLANCRSQLLLDRLGRCLNLFVSTDSTSCQKFARLSSAYTFCIREKHLKLSRIPRRTRYCLFEWRIYRPFNAGENWALTSSWLVAPTHRTATTRMATVVFWCVRVRVPVRECVCARVCACVCAYVRDVFAIYNNNILPRLIMIIIKIIFRYFLEIAHTDDFPSTPG